MTAGAAGIRRTIRQDESDTDRERQPPVNRSKRKGTAAESAVVAYAKRRGVPFAERRALNGGKDRGDIVGIAGVVLEVKSCKEFDLAGWLREAETERFNDGAAVAAVIAKRRGTTDVGRWYALMTGEQLFNLLVEAGYIGEGK